MHTYLFIHTYSYVNIRNQFILVTHCTHTGPWLNRSRRQQAPGPGCRRPIRLPHLCEALAATHNAIYCNKTWVPETDSMSLFQHCICIPANLLQSVKFAREIQKLWTCICGPMRPRVQCRRQTRAYNCEGVIYLYIYIYTYILMYTHGMGSTPCILYLKWCVQSSANGPDICTHLHLFKACFVYTQIATVCVVFVDETQCMHQPHTDPE